jgi:hypothetical protein
MPGPSRVVCRFFFQFNRFMSTPNLPEGLRTRPLTNPSSFNPGFILAVVALVLWGLTYCLEEGMGG